MTWPTWMLQSLERQAALIRNEPAKRRRRSDDIQLERFASLPEKFTTAEVAALFGMPGQWASRLLGSLAERKRVVFAGSRRSGRPGPPIKLWRLA